MMLLIVIGVAGLLLGCGLPGPRHAVSLVLGVFAWILMFGLCWGVGLLLFLLAARSLN